MIEKIVGRLLVDGHITKDEAIIMLGGCPKTCQKEATVTDVITKEEPKKVEPSPVKDDFNEKLKKIIEDATKKREEEKKKQIYPDGWNPFKQPFNPPFPPQRPLWDHDKYKITMDEGPKTFGDICPCNPKNGGSGICNCVMGNQPLWPESDKIPPTVMPIWYQTSSDRIVDTDNAATLGENV